jgi:signal peptidase II
LNSENHLKKALLLPVLLSLGVILIDQVSKIWVKTNMYLNQEFRVLGDWFIIHFTENPGMAFGMEIGGDYGKLFLTVFRIIAVIGLAYYIYYLAKQKASTTALVAFALIFSGALGNIIDSVFYGVVFNDSYYQIAEFMPADGGYGKWLHGYVVDMLYFPIFNGNLPNWVPIFGGDYFVFFRPIFNIADTAISVGVGLIIVFQKRIFKEETKEKLQTDDLEDSPAS